MRTIVLDFDGVIHSYKSGWNGVVPTDGPVPGAREAIDELRKEFKVVVVSTRARTLDGRIAIADWLAKHNIVVDNVTFVKVPAVCYVDDRAVYFDGDWHRAKRQIKQFLEM